jgi:hypothetical protein
MRYDHAGSRWGDAAMDGLSSAESNTDCGLGFTRCARS